MNANDPARLASGRPRFPPKTGSESRQFFRQLRRSQDFFPVKISDRNFRSRREEKLLFLEPVHVFFELRQLGRPDHAFSPHQKRRADFEIAMFAGMQIQHELDQRPLQSRAGTGKADKSASAQLRRALRSKSFSLVPSAT